MILVNRLGRFTGRGGILSLVPGARTAQGMAAAALQEQCREARRAQIFATQEQW